MNEVKRLFDIPYYQQKKYPQSDSLVAKINGQWTPTSTDSFIEQAMAVSKGLLALGIQPGDKVAMVSNNRPEWNIFDIGILQIGAINVPVYPTISEEDYKFIFNHAEVKLCVVSDMDLYTKINNIKGEVPTLEGIYSFDQLDGVDHWSKIKEKGSERTDAEVEALMDKVNEMDLATLIYTSGTTGKPKGVMISHNNIVSNALNCLDRLPCNEHAKALSFLPLCHVYERMLTYLYMLTGVSIYYAESMDTIGDNLREVGPNVFTAVPRLLEKVYDKIVAKGNDLTGIKKKLFFWALELGHEYEVDPPKGGWYNFKLGIARKLIFSKWQEALGGNVEVVASGSAALQIRLARVFNAAGVPIMEGYGLTETSPVVSVNCEKNDGLRFGTVGRVIDNCEVKIAEDGEILVKGPNVMMGYYKREDLTKEVIDQDGWFHTGDIGTMVDGQYLKITDRKKEIFKTSGGKYIAPQVMENKFKESLFIEQIMVVGEYQKMPGALIVPDLEYAKQWAAENGQSCASYQDLCSNDAFKQAVSQEVAKYNKEFGSWEQVKKFELCSAPWAVETGELTPTLKLKRKVILERCQAEFNKIYGL